MKKWLCSVCIKWSRHLIKLCFKKMIKCSEHIEELISLFNEIKDEYNRDLFVHEQWFLDYVDEINKFSVKW